MRVALLDDYQGVAREMANWDSLAAETVTSFADHLSDEDAVVARLSDFDVIVAMRERTAFPRSLLLRLPKLKLLVTTGMWNAAIDVAAAKECGITVCGTRGLGWPTAELTWGLVLALARQIPAEGQAIRDGHWQTTLGVGLRGKTLGVLGLGNLGAQVAAMGRAFGMEIVAWSQNLTAERALEHGATLVSKEDLLARSDFVTVHLILSARTRGLITAADLNSMKRSAFLVNTSRGPIIDEVALASALASGAIAGAALDVFETEPLPMDHPFRSLTNLVMTPHLGYVTKETYEVFYGDALENIRSWASGSPVRVITPSA